MEGPKPGQCSSTVLSIGPFRDGRVSHQGKGTYIYLYKPSGCLRELNLIFSSNTAILYLVDIEASHSYVRFYHLDTAKRKGEYHMHHHHTHKG